MGLFQVRGVLTIVLPVPLCSRPVKPWLANRGMASSPIPTVNVVRHKSQAYLK